MTDLEIRKQIAAYVAGDVAAHELEDRLENAAWDVDTEAIRTLAGTALRLLAEYGNGDWTNDELQERLGSLSRTYWFLEAPKTGAEATVILQDQRPATAGRWRVAESV